MSKIFRRFAARFFFNKSRKRYIARKNTGCRFWKPPAKPAGKVAEFERELIRERTMGGLAAARSRGKLGGRKPVLNAEKQKTVATLLKAAKRDKSEPDTRAIARNVGVSERTIRRFVNGTYVANI